MRIAYFREKAGLTQAELAAKIPVTQTAVCKWEKGINAPRRLLIPALAAALNVTIEELTAEEPPR